MTRQDLDELEMDVMEQVVKLRKLGDYSAEAASIFKLTEQMFKVVQHLRNKQPRVKPKSK